MTANSETNQRKLRGLVALPQESEIFDTYSLTRSLPLPVLTSSKRDLYFWGRARFGRERKLMLDADMFLFVVS